MRFALPTLTLLIAFYNDVPAQWPATVTPGARVQVRLPELQYQFVGPRGHAIRGRVNTLTPDTLYLSVTDSLGPLPIPRRMIDRLQVSRGVPSRFNSALRSGLVSAVGTALISVGLNELDDEPGRLSVGEAALLGGGVGLVFGGTMGAIFPAERWKRVPLE
jgi:hypothetical protein